MSLKDAAEVSRLEEENARLVREGDEHARICFQKCDQLRAQLAEAHEQRDNAITLADTLLTKLAEAQEMQKGAEYSESCLWKQLVQIEQIAQGLAECGTDEAHACALAKYNAYQKRKTEGVVRAS